MKKKVNILLLVVLFSCSFGLADDFGVIEGRLRHLALGFQPGEAGTEPLSAREAAEADKLLAKQKEDGSWPGIDYASRQRSFWPSSEHMNNLVKLCQVGCRIESGMPDRERYLAAVHKGISFWREKKLRCDNWWHHDIFMPRVAGELMLMLGDEARDDEREFLVNGIMAKSKIGMTGQNKIWVSDNVFVRSLIVNDREMLGKAIRSILEELKVTTGEGMQPDWSFHQHGSQLQFGNYGLAFVGNMVKWLWVVGGTEFEDKSQVELMRNYILNGQRWVVWKDYYDISSCGRQINAGQPNSKARSLANGCRYMKMLDVEYADEYEQYLDRLYGREGVKDLVGNKYFWRSDYMIHRRDDFMVSVKMNSKDVLAVETGGNKENQLGYFLNDGACYLYRSGKEYKDIFPAWNWRQVPGTTVRQNETSPPKGGWRNEGNKKEFVGGVSDGTNGFCVMDYDVEGVKAKKGWFSCGDMLVCLGAGIASDSNDSVYTTVNQCHLEKASLVDSSESRLMHYGNFVVETGQWVEHDGFVYDFPEKQDVKLECCRQSGSWKMVSDEKSDKKIEHEIFKLYIDHGVRPQGAKYSYVVWPESKPQDRLPEVVSNSSAIQAVSWGRYVMAAFYKPAKLSWGAGSMVVDKPCVVMLEIEGDGKELVINAADPRRGEDKVMMQVECGEIEYKTELDLPKGGMAGSGSVLRIR